MSLFGLVLVQVGPLRLFLQGGDALVVLLRRLRDADPGVDVGDVAVPGRGGDGLERVAVAASRRRCGC
jgi:hypothetical protein